jgi:hypothetical protein
MRRNARRIWRLVMAGALVCAAASPASAIILHAWTFEELAGASDEVLLVQHLVARDTGRRTKWPLPGSRFSFWES